MNVSKFMKLNI